MKFMLLPFCVYAVRKASKVETDQSQAQDKANGAGSGGVGCTFTEPYANFIQSWTQLV